MAKFNLKFDASDLNRLAKQIKRFPKGAIDNQTAKRVGREIVKQIKDFTRKGISPVRGGGVRARMPAYKNPLQYPGRRKRRRPVNLRLSGDFMRSLTFTSVNSRTGKATRVFYRGQNNNKKEQGHAVGANRQPRRPTLPGAVNRSARERFAPSILQALNKIYLSRINRLVARLNRRR